MAIIDMPLKDMKNYYGTNPCPEDFDEFWNRAIMEMKGIDSNVKLVENDFKVPFADCFDLYFTGVKGAKIHAKFIKPKNINGKAPAIIKFHGYKDSSSPFSTLIGYAALGYVVAALDCRGQGGISEDTCSTIGPTVRGHILRGLNDEPENLLYRDIFLDTAQIAGIIMDMPFIDENRVAAIGESQGGALAISCAALEPRIKKVASMYPFLADYKRVFELDINNSAYEELVYYFRYFDPRHERENEIFEKLGYIDIQNLAGKIKGEVLMATALNDNICPPSTQFAVYNKIQSKKEMIIYPEFGHEYIADFEDIRLKFLMEI